MLPTISYLEKELGSVRNVKLRTRRLVLARATFKALFFLEVQNIG